jgi:hypothetical protein
LALTTAVWLVTRRKIACSARSVLELQRPAFYGIPCPQFLRGSGWVGGAEYLQIYVGWILNVGKDGGYLARFCLVIQGLCFAEIANMNCRAK